MNMYDYCSPSLSCLVLSVVRCISSCRAKVCGCTKRQFWTVSEQPPFGSVLSSGCSLGWAHAAELHQSISPVNLRFRGCSIGFRHIQGWCFEMTIMWHCLLLHRTGWQRSRFYDFPGEPWQEKWQESTSRASVITRVFQIFLPVSQRRALYDAVCELRAYQHCAGRVRLHALPCKHRGYRFCCSARVPHKVWSAQHGQGVHEKAPSKARTCSATGGTSICVSLVCRHRPGRMVKFCRGILATVVASREKLGTPSVTIPRTRRC